MFEKYGLMICNILKSGLQVIVECTQGILNEFLTCSIIEKGEISIRWGNWVFSLNDVEECSERGEINSLLVLSDLVEGGGVGGQTNPLSRLPKMGGVIEVGEVTIWNNVLGVESTFIVGNGISIPGGCSFQKSEKVSLGAVYSILTEWLDFGHPSDITSEELSIELAKSLIFDGFGWKNSLCSDIVQHRKKYRESTLRNENIS